jgi:hypothetical protein
MCGIVYGKSFKDKPINKTIIQQYRSQRTRGIQGFGVFDVEFRHIIKEPTEGKIMKWLENKPSKEILFHHRFPTSTENVRNACHPFSTKDHFGDTQYVFVHNGSVNNSRSLRSTHEAMGIKYSSIQKDNKFNDSEALMWDVALYLEGKQNELKATGSIAFICIAITPTARTVYFARNSSPLKLFKSNKHMMLSSEGHGIMIDSNQLHSYNEHTGKIMKVPLIIPTYVSTYIPKKYDKDDGREDTIKEIQERWGAKRKSVNDPIADYEYEEYDDSDEYNDSMDKEANTFDMLINDYGNMEKDIKDEVRKAMTIANGYYELAVSMLDEDIEKAEGGSIVFVAKKQYDIEIKKSARAILISDPTWDKNKGDAQDEVYMSVEDKKQLSLIPGQVIKPTTKSIQEIVSEHYQISEHQQPVSNAIKGFRHDG